jgi:hypothetical protein
VANLILVSVSNLECDLNEAVRNCPCPIRAQPPPSQVAVVELVNLLAIGQKVKEEERGHDLRPALIPRSSSLRGMVRDGRKHGVSPGEDTIPGDCPIRAIECEHHLSTYPERAQHTRVVLARRSDALLVDVPERIP